MADSAPALLPVIPAALPTAIGGGIVVAMPGSVTRLFDNARIVTLDRHLLELAGRYAVRLFKLC